jgi:Arc/MetJ-type ribon-helix-helix transcriptional regulator
MMAINPNVPVKMTPELIRHIDRIVSKGLFRSRSEYVRYCILKEIKAESSGE